MSDPIMYLITLRNVYIKNTFNLKISLVIGIIISKNITDKKLKAEY